MKIFRNIFIIATAVLIAVACDNDGIDPISRAEPGPDEMAPVIDITSPATEKIIIPVTETETDVEFEFEVNDDIELESIVVSLNGAQLASYTSFKDYRRLVTSLPYENLPVGNHTIEVSATDLTGKAATESFSFEVSNKYVPKDGEIFYMAFEGNESLDLISEATGTFSGTPLFTEGKVGKALSFDATAKSYLLFPGDAIAAVQSFTISFWVNPDFVDTDDNGGIDGILGLVNLSNVSSFWGNIDLFVENGSNPDGAIIKGHVTNGNGGETWIDNVTGVENFFGQWSHHAVSFDAAASEFKYYINGALVATKAAGWGSTELVFADSGPMVFGAVHFQTDPSLTSATGTQPWASYLTGELDEIRVFNKALSGAAIEELYQEAN